MQYSRAQNDTISSKPSSQVSLIGEIATVNPGASLIHYQQPSFRKKAIQRGSIQDSLIRSSQNENFPHAMNLKQKMGLSIYGNKMVGDRRKTFNELV